MSSQPPMIPNPAAGAVNPPPGVNPVNVTGAAGPANPAVGAAAARRPGSKTFKELLVEWGVDDVMADAIIAQGITGTESLIKGNEKLVENVLKHMRHYPPTLGPGQKMFIPYQVQRNLEIMQFGAKFWFRANRIMPPEFFNDNILSSLERRMEELRLIRQRYKDMPPKKPDSLKSMDKFKVFWDQWKAYMEACYGSADCPLSYVFRTKEAPDASANWNNTSVDEISGKIFVLSGQHFNLDNTKVWEELYAVVRDGPGYTFIRAFERKKDGRAACMALVRQGEGEGATELRAQKAHRKLESLKWDGPRANWTWDKFIQQHQDAHEDLVENNEAIPETRKVTLLLAGITDKDLANSVDVAQPDVEERRNFDKSQLFLGQGLASKAADGKSAKRQISAISTDAEISAGPKSKRFKGKGKGKFKGKGESRVTPTAEDLDPKNLKKRPYKVWQEMLKNHKKEVDAIFEFRRNQNRNVSDVTVEDSKPSGILLSDRFKSKNITRDK